LRRERESRPSVQSNGKESINALVTRRSCACHFSRRRGGCVHACHYQSSFQSVHMSMCTRFNAGRPASCAIVSATTTSLEHSTLSTAPPPRPAAVARDGSRLYPMIQLALFRNAGAPSCNGLPADRDRTAVEPHALIRDRHVGPSCDHGT
jgi:hypothetical protein